jgi:hypothetical protein
MKDVYAMVMELEKALNEEREKISEMWVIYTKKISVHILI